MFWTRAFWKVVRGTVSPAIAVTGMGAVEATGWGVGVATGAGVITVATVGVFPAAFSTSSATIRP